jgi:hypothetical protein
MPGSHATAAYAFSLERQAEGAGAAKNFLSLWNPAGTRPVTITALFLSSVASVNGVTYPMRGFRISAQPTGGTLADNATEVCKFDTGLVDTAVELRYNNPTATPGAALFNSPNAQAPGDATDVHQIDAPPGFNPFLLRPGEGILLRQGLGAAANMWNLSIIWRELRS